MQPQGGHLEGHRRSQGQVDCGRVRSSGERGHSKLPPDPKGRRHLSSRPVIGSQATADPEDTYPGPQGCGCLRQASCWTQDPALSWDSRAGSPGQRAGRAGRLGAAERACGLLDPGVWGPGTGPGHCSGRTRRARGRGGWPPYCHPGHCSSPGHPSSSWGMALVVPKDDRPTPHQPRETSA